MMSIGRNSVATTPSLDVPCLQYANSKTMARVTSPRFEPLVGFHSEAGRIEGFDDLCKEMKVQQISIKHPRAGGDPEVKLHWYFGESITLYPLTAGPTTSTMTKAISQAREMAAAGIGVRWVEGEKSRMAVWGYILIGADPVLVRLTTSSRMTDVLLSALLTHVEVCEKYDDIVGRMVECYEVPMVLRAGEEESWGSGASTTVIPFVYAASPASPNDCPARIRRDVDESWEDVREWALEFAMGKREDTPVASPEGLETTKDTGSVSSYPSPQPVDTEGMIVTVEMKENGKGEKGVVFRLKNHGDSFLWWNIPRTRLPFAESLKAGSIVGVRAVPHTVNGKPVMWVNEIWSVDEDLPF